VLKSDVTSEWTASILLDIAAVPFLERRFAFRRGQVTELIEIAEHHHPSIIMSSRDGRDTGSARLGRPSDEDGRDPPERIPKKPRGSNSGTIIDSSNKGRECEGDEEDMDPVARARRALEMYQEVTGEGLDNDDTDVEDHAHPGRATTATEEENGTCPTYDQEAKKERNSMNGNGTFGGRKGMKEIKRSNVFANDNAEKKEASALLTREEAKQKKKEREEEEARGRKRKEAGEAQRRAFRPTIATVQDSSCLL
jgi:hypothetical protein